MRENPTDSVTDLAGHIAAHIALDQCSEQSFKEVIIDQLALAFPKVSDVRVEQTTCFDQRGFPAGEQTAPPSPDGSEDLSAESLFFLFRKPSVQFTRFFVVFVKIGKPDCKSDKFCCTSFMRRPSRSTSGNNISSCSLWISASAAAMSLSRSATFLYGNFRLRLAVLEELTVSANRNRRIFHRVAGGLFGCYLATRSSVGNRHPSFNQWR